MSRTSMVLLAVAAILAWASPAAAQISVVVSSSSSYQPSDREIAEIFVGVRTTWSDGSKVRIVDQPETAVGQQFYRDFLKRTPAQVRLQITRLVFSGEAMPPQRLANAAAVKAAVASHPHAIGYIATSALDDSVREVHRISQ